ncbi:MAG: CgeB family protein [Coriobacteriia bacterium]
MLCRHIQQFRPDCTVLASSWPESPVLMCSRIRDAGSGVLFGWLGAPPERAARNGRLLELMAQLDVVVVYDPEHASELRRAGIRDVRVLPLSADTVLIQKVIGATEAARDIAIGFCGRVDEERVPYLEALASLGLVVWTSSHIRSEALSVCVRGGVAGPEMYRALSRCKIGLNVHNSAEVTGGNARTYEVPACGALLLADDKPGVRQAFVSGREVVLFSSPEEARAEVQRLLADWTASALIAKRGRERVDATHSVDSRVAVMRGWMNEMAACT